MKRLEAYRELKRLKEKSFKKQLGFIAWDWSFILFAFIGAALIDHLIGYFLAVLVIGNRQHALGIVAHEGTHGLIHPNKTLNEVISNLFCFFPIMATVSGYRHFHFNHHQNTGTTEDPEKKVLNTFAYRLPLTRTRVVLTFIGDLFGLGLPEFARFAKEIFPRRKLDLIGLGVFWGAIVFTSYHFGALWIPVLWTYALLTTFWAFSRIRTYTEHVGTTGTHRFAASEWFKRVFYPHYTSYHYEHHAHPTVPAYNLPRVRELERYEKVLSYNELYDWFSNGSRRENKPEKLALAH